MIERRLSGPAPKAALPPGGINTQLHVHLPGFPAIQGGPDSSSGLSGLAEYRQVKDWPGIDRFVIRQGNAIQNDNASVDSALKEDGDVTSGVAVINNETADDEIESLPAAVVRTIADYAPERIVWGTNFPHNAASRTEDYPDDVALLATVLGRFPDDRGLRLALVSNPEELYGFSPFQNSVDTASRQVEPIRYAE